MITQIRFINCQSLEDCIINFAQDKLNVIIAPNNTGKSILYKILKITACPNIYTRSEQQSLISWGAECATVMYACSSNTVIIVRIFPNKVIYGIKHEKDTCWTKTLYPTDEILKELGLLANSSENFIANLIDTDQSLLLVDKNLKSNVELVSFMVTSEELDTIALRDKNLLKEFRESQSMINTRLDYTKSLIDSIKYVDTSKMESEIEVSQAGIDVYRELGRTKNLFTTIENVMQYAKDYDVILNIHELLCDLETLNLKDIQVTTKDIDVNFVDTLLVLEELDLTSITVDTAVTDFDTVITFVEELETLEQLNGLLVSNLEKLEHYVFSDFDSADSILQELADLELLGSCLIDIAKAEDTSNAALNLISELNTVIKDNYEVLKCPIHKEIIYDGENCIPYSE